MINKNNLLKGISDADEKKIFAKALDKANLAVKIQSPQFSDFMDPYKAHKLKELCFSQGFDVLLYGGYDEAERLKVGFFPSFENEYSELFPISNIEVSYNGRYSRKLTHRDFLGSVLGLGITREKIGDIIIEDERAVLFTDTDIADYIIVNLERVGHTKVNTKILQSYNPEQSKGQEKRLTVASLRIDAVLSGALNISRGKTADLIKGEKAFVNWRQITSVSETIKEGDMITLRGAGRVKVTEILGTTKKDRILINTEIYK